MRCVYDRDHMYIALQIKNTSDPRSSQATKPVVKKAQKKIEASTGFEPMTS